MENEKAYSIHSTSDESLVTMEVYGSKFEPLDASFDFSYAKQSLSYIPLGYSCLYVAPEGTTLDQLPPKKVGGILTQLAQPYQSIVATRVGKNKFKYKFPDALDRFSHVPVTLTKEDLQILQELCTVEDLGGHKISDYIYPLIEGRTHGDPDEIIEALLQRDEAQEALFED